MTQVPTVTLYDMGTREGIEGNEAILTKTRLLEPFAAIQWIATGSFNEPSGPRDWYSCVERHLMMEMSSADGRRELAEEILVGAIGSGALRCAFVTDSPAPRQPWESPAWARLTVVDPQLFRSAGYISHGWESEGLEITVGRDEEDDDPASFAGFWLFWDEVQRLRPAPLGGGHVDAAPPAALPTISATSILPRLPVVPDNHIAAASPASTTHRRGKGRPAGKNGEPIAMFVLRVQAEGSEKLDGLSDDALGAMLKEEYFRLGLNQPENTNAARDARGVLRALMKMQVKSEAQAVE